MNLDDFDAEADCWRSVAECYRVIRARVAAGGEGWQPRPKAGQLAGAGAGPAPESTGTRERNLEEVRKKHREQQRIWRATPHGKRMKRDLALRKAYGITLEQLEAMIEAQGGVCPICQEKISAMGKG